MKKTYVVEIKNIADLPLTKETVKAKSKYKAISKVLKRNEDFSNLRHIHLKVIEIKGELK